MASPSFLEPLIGGKSNWDRVVQSEAADLCNALETEL